MRILYELHTLKQRRAYMNLRAEIEQSGRVKVEKEVIMLKCLLCNDFFNKIRFGSCERRYLI